MTYIFHKQEHLLKEHFQTKPTTILKIHYILIIYPKEFHYTLSHYLPDKPTLFMSTQSQLKKFKIFLE